MRHPELAGILIRKANRMDAARWLELLTESLGPDYAARQIYDLNWVAEELANNEGEETWVAESNGRFLRSMTILSPFSANDNPIANLGRQLALPEAQADGSGEALLRKMNDICAQRRQIAILRVPEHDLAQQELVEKLGFACVGFQPAKHLFRVRDGVLFYVRVGAPAAAMRLALSQSLPQIVELASAVLLHLQIANPEIVRDGATGYPVQAELNIHNADLAQYEAARQQTQNPQTPIEIFGQFNRGLGVFRVGGPPQVGALLGERGGKITAGLSYYFDDCDSCVKLVDSFSTDEFSTGPLLRQMSSLAQDHFQALYLEVDFLVTAPRVLKTAEQLGFVPVAFLPGFYQRGGCRLDLVKMVKLNTDYSLNYDLLTPHAAAVVNLIDRNFKDQKVGLSTINLLRSLSAFEGLGDGELGKVARLFAKKLYQANELIFNQGDSGDAAYIVMRGQVNIYLADHAEPVARLEAGSIFGEQAFLDGALRNAMAMAAQPTILLVIQRPEFNALIQTEANLGLVIMRNMALDLSRKLRETNLALTARSR